MALKVLTLSPVKRTDLAQQRSFNSGGCGHSGTHGVKGIQRRDRRGEGVRKGLHCLSSTLIQYCAMGWAEKSYLIAHCLSNQSAVLPHSTTKWSGVRQVPPPLLFERTCGRTEKTCFQAGGQHPNPYLEAPNTSLFEASNGAPDSSSDTSSSQSTGASGSSLPVARSHISGSP